MVCSVCVDVAIICEQYTNRANTVWAQDSSGKAAIWACGCGQKAIEEVMERPEQGFVWAKIGGRLSLAKLEVPPYLAAITIV